MPVCFTASNAAFAEQFDMFGIAYHRPTLRIIALLKYYRFTLQPIGTTQVQS